MKQNVGFSAIIIAFIALAIRTGTPVAQPGQSGRAQAPTPETNPTPTEMLAGPWLATRSFFRAADPPEAPAIDFDVPASVQSCAAAGETCGTQLAKYFGISVPNHVQFLI